MKKIKLDGEMGWGTAIIFHCLITVPGKKICTSSPQLPIPVTTPSHQPSLHHASIAAPTSRERSVCSLVGAGRIVGRPECLIPSLSGNASLKEGIHSYNFRHIVNGLKLGFKSRNKQTGKSVQKTNQLKKKIYQSLQ
ncbi:hypothetical protein TorRG33x02_100880 [Trema orientale]|uniref:Uncharacterized protein n=1 Tax=Trema orientale TaxID=63057 RepID=A0A2P5F8E9_TREOI|nr:hypothetical protein TorRG33x02_100880 [Trema orientale]